MGGEGATEFEYQAGKFVPLSNYKINEMNKYQFYADLLQREIK